MCLVGVVVRRYRIAGNFHIIRMKASVCENKKCEIYANASTRTYVVHVA